MQRLTDELKRKKKASGLSWERAAAAVGVTAKTLREIVDGKRMPQEGTIRMIAEWLGMTDVAVRQIMQPSAGRGVPVVGDLSHGPLTDFRVEDHVDSERPELPLPLDWFPGCVAMRVVGTSMAPKYMPGDYVVLRSTDPAELVTGWECYVQCDGAYDDGSTLKKIVALDGELILLAINDGEHESVRVKRESVLRAARAIGLYRPFVKGFGFEGKGRK